MADTTTVMALPYPEGSDANDVPADMQALAERLDEAPGIESLTSAEISALTSPQKPAGRVVYNSTTGKLQVSNGTSFADVDAAALLKAGGTMAGNIAMGGSKVTGLAAASANGDAVRYEQAALRANNLSDLASAATARSNLGLGTAATTAATAYATAAQGATADAALARAGGTMSGGIAMGNNKVTGLARGTASGDAIAHTGNIQTGYITVNATTGTVTFSPAFASQPVVVATPVEGGSNFRRVTLTGVTSSGFTWLTDVANGSYITWIAVL